MTNNREANRELELLQENLISSFNKEALRKMEDIAELFTQLVLSSADPDVKQATATVIYEAIQENKITLAPMKAILARFLMIKTIDPTIIEKIYKELRIRDVSIVDYLMSPAGQRIINRIASHPNAPIWILNELSDHLISALEYVEEHSPMDALKLSGLRSKIRRIWDRADFLRNRIKEEGLDKGLTEDIQNMPAEWLKEIMSVPIYLPKEGSFDFYPADNSIT